MTTTTAMDNFTLASQKIRINVDFLEYLFDSTNRDTSRTGIQQRTVFEKD